MKNYTMKIIAITFCFSFCQFYAQSNLDSLISIIDNAEGAQKIETLNTVARELADNDPVQALKYAEQARDLAISVGDKSQQASALMNIGLNYSRLGKNNFAKEFYFESKNIYEELKDTSGIAVTVGELGTVYNAIGMYDSARICLDYALTVSEARNDTSTYYRHLVNLGVIYLNQSQFKLALQVYLKALKYFEKTNNSTTISIIYNNIGNVYSYLKDYEKALEYFNSYYLLAKKEQNLFSQDIALTNIASCYEEKEMFEEATNYFLQSLTIAQSIEDLEGVGIIYNSLGHIDQHLGKYEKALKYHFDALEIFKRLGIQREEIVCLRHLGELYKNKRNFNKALFYGKKTLKLAKDISIQEEIVKSYKLLAEISDLQKDYKNAYNFLRLYKENQDSLNAQNSQLQIAELEQEYLNEQKEIETALLRQENEFQKQIIEAQKNIAIAIAAGLIIVIVFIVLLYRNRKRLRETKDWLDDRNIKLEKLNTTKDKFFSIVAHDLKNPFGSILNSTDLLNTHYNELTEEEKRALIQSINNSANNVNRLLENMLTWARTQRGGLKLKKQELLIRELIDSAVAPFLPLAKLKGIEINREGVSKDLNISADKFMMEVVIANLTNNAIKFSFPDSMIKITAIETDGKIEIGVKDEGVGISKDVVDNLFKIDKSFTTKGTEDEAGSGLGLIICKDFIDIHNGDINVTSEKEKGTKFSIILPAD
ncbi:MAG: tetratricopeptide repeat-containing sensor histidine kinase [Bacteroidetes bacterium]|nr:tetratricopeptide repeat-containing sensor histidine kinase [Bacteroidota bacterium]